MKIKIWIIAAILSVSTLQADILDLWKGLKPEQQALTVTQIRLLPKGIWQGHIAPQIVKNIPGAFLPLVIAPDKTLTGHKEGLNSVQWSPPDGKKFLTVSKDKIAIVWDAASGKELFRFTGHTDEIAFAQWSPDGKKILTVSSANDMIVIVWDATSGKELLKLPGYTQPMWSSDGKKILTVSSANDMIPRVWDATSGKKLLTLTAGRIRFAKWSPDGTKFFTASNDFPSGNNIVWDATSGKELFKLEGHTSWVNSVQWSPDGKKMATAADDKTARVWNATSGNELLKLPGHTEVLNSAQWNSDGKRILTASRDNTARVWDTVSGKELLMLGHPGEVILTRWSPDDTRILTASLGKTDTALAPYNVWDATSGKKLFKLEGHTDWIPSAQWSPVGAKIGTTSVNNTSKIYDLQPFDAWLKGTFTKEQTLFVLLLYGYRANMPPKQKISFADIAEKNPTVTPKELTTILKSFSKPIQRALKITYNLQ